MNLQIPPGWRVEGDNTQSPTPSPAQPTPAPQTPAQTPSTNLVIPPGWSVEGTTSATPVTTTGIIKHKAPTPPKAPVSTKPTKPTNKPIPQRPTPQHPIQQPGPLQQAEHWATTGWVDPKLFQHGIVPGLTSQITPGLAGAAQDLSTGQHALANAPGIRDIGNAQHALANTPPLAAAGQAIRAGANAVIDSTPAKWVENKLGNSWPAQQVANWMRAHPEDTKSIITLANVWGDAGQILGLTGLGAAGLSVAARFAMRGATKEVAAKAAKDAAAQLAAGTSTGEKGLVAKSLEKPPITRFDPANPGEVIETPQETGSVTTARQGVGKAIHPLTAEGITGQVYPFGDRLRALSKTSRIAIPALVAKITQESKTSGRSFDAVLGDYERAAQRNAAVATRFSPQLSGRIQALAGAQSVSTSAIINQLTNESKNSGQSFESVLANHERQWAHALEVPQSTRDTANDAAQGQAQSEVEQGTTQQTRENAQGAVAAQAVANNPGTPPMTVNIPLSKGLLATLAHEAQTLHFQGGPDLSVILKYLDEQHRIQQVGGDLGDQLFAIRQQSNASAIRVRSIIRDLGNKATQADWESVYHALENPASVNLTPVQKSLYNVFHRIVSETEGVKLSLPRQFRPISGIGYVRRFALGKGSLADKLQTGAFTGKGSLLRRTMSSFKHRTYATLTDADGNRQVVAISRKRLKNAQGISYGGAGRIMDAKGNFLGTMARMKSFEELMARDLKPSYNKLDKIQKGLNVFKGWAERRPARVNKIVDALTKEMHDVTSQLADDLTNMSPKLTTALRGQQREIEQLMDSFKAASATGGNTAAAKFESLQNQLNKTRLAIKNIEAKYDGQDLKDRVFVGKDKKRYTLGPATTMEIESQTPQRYYKNAMVSTLIDHLETMDIARSYHFLEHLKTDPEFLRVAAPQAEAWQHPHWVKSEVSAFQGWVMDPKVADALNAALPQSRNSRDLMKGLRWLSRKAIDIGFFNPFIHTPNVGINWTIDRGVLRWMNPASYKRLIVSSVKAWNAAAHINSDYEAIMRNGGALMQEGTLASHVRDAILDKARDELHVDPGILQGLAMQYGIPVKSIVNAPWWLSHRITWGSNDFAYLQRVFEREMEGMDRQTAIRETERFIPNYRVPGRILGSSDLSRIMRDSGAVIFAPYHYGLLKGWGQMTKDLIPWNTTPQRALEAASKLAMAGILFFGIAPKMDQAFQNLTGNRNARVRRAGFLTPAYDLSRYIQGTMPADYALESVVSPSPLVGTAIDIEQRRPEWTSPTSSPDEQITALGRIAFQGMGPISLRQMVQQGTPWWQALATSPLYTASKYGPNETAVHSWMINNRDRLQGQVNRVAESDPSKARDMIAAQNARLRTLVAKALKEEGTPDKEIPDMVQTIVEGAKDLPGLGLHMPTDYGISQTTQRTQAPWTISQYAEPQPRRRKGASFYEKQVP